MMNGLESQNLSNYPKSLQLLMQTDGTVTDLVKLLAGEEIKVIKLLELRTLVEQQNILNRRIYLQGVDSLKNWVYAESIIYLDNLSDEFVNDLINNTIPIGTLWMNYRMETFKSLISKEFQITSKEDSSGFPENTELLSRKYQVFNSKKLIMEINEKFPIKHYSNLF
jgi:chorismate-pyruvate lyase